MTTTIELRAEIDAATAPPLRTEIYKAIDAHPGSVVTLDLAHLEFIDSTGLGVLVGALKKARLSDGDIVVTEPVGHVAKVFSVTGLEKVFKVVAFGS